MEERLLVGLDLCRDFTQLACYHERTGQPESFGVRTGAFGAREEQYMIPTCLAVKRGSREWIIGDEARRLVEADEAIDAGDLLEKAETGTVTEIYEGRFAPEELLERFFRKVLTLLRREYPDGKIARLVVSLEESGTRADRSRQEQLEETVRHALERMGIEADRVQIQSHMTSFLYYTIHQKKELWQHDTAIFEFRDGGLHYVQLSVDDRQKPMVAAVTERDLSDHLKLEDVARDPAAAGNAFREAALTALHRKLISTVYATGRGFEGDWADEGLMALCTGRKVFKGQNLYARGACYAAYYGMQHPLEEERLIFLGEEHTSAEWSMEVYQDGKVRELVLLPPALRWEEAHCQWDFILDEMEGLELQIRNYITGQRERHLLTMEGLPERERKRTRIRLEIRYTDLQTARIRLTDLGFGEMAVAGGIGRGAGDAGQSWESVLHF